MRRGDSWSHSPIPMVSVHATEKREPLSNALIRNMTCGFDRKACVRPRKPDAGLDRDEPAAPTMRRASGGITGLDH